MIVRLWRWGQEKLARCLIPEADEGAPGVLFFAGTARLRTETAPHAVQIVFSFTSFS
jgi:hypothetical protein